MKKFITISGFIASVITIIGMIFKMEHIAGASPCIVLGLSFLILFFLPSFGYNLMYDFTNKKSKFAGVFGSLLFISIGAGALFKIQHWSGAGIMYLIEFLILCFLLLPALMIVKIRASSSSTEKWLQFSWYLFLSIVSLGFLFKINHFPYASLLLATGTTIMVFGYLPLAFKLYNNDEQRSKLHNRFVMAVAGLVYILLVSVSLNVGVLNSFLSIDSSIRKSSEYLGLKNKDMYERLNKEKDSEQQMQYLKVMKVKELSHELYNYIEKLKIYLMKTIQGSQNDSITIEQIDGKDNFDAPTRILIGDPDNPKQGSWSATELKAKLQVYRQDLISMFDNKDKEVISKTIGINTDDAYSLAEDGKVSWEDNNFYHTPIVAVITTLSNLQNNVRSAESTTLDMLYKNFIKENNFKLDSRITRGDTILLYKAKK